MSQGSTTPLGNRLEKLLYEDHPNLPRLVKAGLVQVQLETIHPFLNGNGRLGRLLITFLLCEWSILNEGTEPL